MQYVPIGTDECDFEGVVVTLQISESRQSGTVIVYALTHVLVRVIQHQNNAHFVRKIHLMTFARYYIYIYIYTSR